VAFSAATSIATIGLYISYALPILISVLWPQKFVKGPFNLGQYSRPVGVIACLWVCTAHIYQYLLSAVLCKKLIECLSSLSMQVLFITITFCLPTANPVTSQTLNYTPVAVGIVAAGSLGSWFLWAHRWFKGPLRQIELEQPEQTVLTREQEEEQDIKST
jgi:hypothetical protein